MIYTEELNDLIINRHTENGADKIIFMGGFIGPGPIENIKDQITSTIDCKIIYNCYKRSSKNLNFHEKYKNITSNSNVDVLYKNSYNHSKIYMWLKNNTPVDIIMGSANFSTSGLCNNNQEILMEVENTYYSDVKKYIDIALRDSQTCTAVTPVIPKQIPIQIPPIINSISGLDKIISINPPVARIYFKSDNTGVPKKSGLNWGFGSGHVAKDCAYIPLRNKILQGLPSLFPYNGKNPNHKMGQKIRNNNQIAEGLFDDGTIIKLSFEGIQGNGHFKQMTSFPQKNIMGIYIRKRLGLGNYDQINDGHLKSYGRDNIDISKIDEGLYYLDFSV